MSFVLHYARQLDDLEVRSSDCNTIGRRQPRQAQDQRSKRSLEMCTGVIRPPVNAAIRRLEVAATQERMQLTTANAGKIVSDGTNGILIQ
jgi:hypothetical protein